MSDRIHTAIFQPMGIRARIENGTTLRAAARAVGVDIESLCGERTNCGKCKLILQPGTFAKEGITSRQDHLSPMNADEKEYWARRQIF